MVQPGTGSKDRMQMQTHTHTHTHIQSEGCTHKVKTKAKWRGGGGGDGLQWLFRASCLFFQSLEAKDTSHGWSRSSRPFHIESKPYLMSDVTPQTSQTHFPSLATVFIKQLNFLRKAVLFVAQSTPLLCKHENWIISDFSVIINYRIFNTLSHDSLLRRHRCLRGLPSIKI